MACTNRRCGWPGYRWGRGPGWATTGVIRPVAETTCSVDVTVDDFTGEWAHQQFVDPAVAEESTRCAVWCSAAVVDLAGCEPAIGHHQVSAVAGGLVGQLRPDRTHCRVGDGPPVGAPPHAAFHRSHVEVFEHHVAIAARQLGGELVGSRHRLPLRSCSVARGQPPTCQSRSEHQLCGGQPRIHHHTCSRIRHRGGGLDHNPPTRSAGTGNVPSRN
jgi:hypothetical protein